MTHTTRRKNDKQCKFCGKHAYEVNSMVEGPDGIFLCDECIATCVDAIMNDTGMVIQPREDGALRFVFPEELINLLNHEKQGKHLSRQAKGSAHVTHSQKEQPSVTDEESLESILSNLPTPHAIFDELSDYVVGQDEAKRALSIAVYNHYKRIFMAQKGVQDDAEVAKSNILLLGPTGSGKTLLAQTLARLLRVPFAIADATALTEAGYVGEDVENILVKLVKAADYDVKRAEIGIIYIDEIDKIARKAENVSITRDVSGEGVQQALLKIVEGCQASIPPEGGRKHPEQKLLDINTENILFILGGAFVGLSEIIAQRLNASTIGFNSQIPKSKSEKEAELLRQALPQDLTTYGMIPEFVGRIPVITYLNELNEDDLVRILTEPKNALVKQYAKIFEYDDAKITFTKDALFAIAREAIQRKTGARGLRSICEEVLADVMFDIPEKEGNCSVEITESDITGKTSPKIVVDKPKKSQKSAS